MMEFVKKNIKTAIAFLVAITFFNNIKPLFNALFTNIYEFLWKQPALDVFDTHSTSRNFFSSIFSTISIYVSSILIACGVLWIANAAERNKVASKDKDKEPSPRSPESPGASKPLERIRDQARASPRSVLASQATPAANTAIARGQRIASPRPPSPIPGSKGNSPRADQVTGVSTTTATGLQAPSSISAKGQLDVLAIAGRRRSPSMEASSLGRSVTDLRVNDQLRGARARSMGGANESPVRPDPNNPLSSSGEVLRVEIRTGSNGGTPSPHPRPAIVPPLLLAPVAPPPPLSPRGTAMLTTNLANLPPPPPPPPITPRPK